jgi:uncharacterized protein YfaA (DUF2138 family)
MKQLLSIIFFLIVLAIMFNFSPTLSFAEEDKVKNKALDYIEKLEELIIDVVPEDQKEQIENLFDELRDFLEKKLDSEEESEPLKETMWFRKINIFAM